MHELYIKNLEEPNVDASAGATVNEKTTSPFDLKPSALTMDFRLLEGKHVADIAAASAKTPAVGMTKQQMIANLKEVSKMLGEKKELVDGVIQALEFAQPQANEDGVGPSHGFSRIRSEVEEKNDIINMILLEKRIKTTMISWLTGC
ncbi:unnamed protein product [Trifolium pratense]|uniref:Uncharacterized protein n=1 Tax=Trifolium pratense TaxID=57577 RepID=A0ACB0IV79_TRIPR|nr:unnamed protein product [Trifolium pratense]